MRPAPRRGLFWQVYLTLLISLAALALLGAAAWHMSGMTPMAARFAAHGLGVLLIAAAIVGAAAYPVMAWATRRLEALRRSVEAWGQGSLSHRARVDGNDEIATVAASFNAAADHVERLLAAHKTLLAQASHELRSPLTRLALAAEMLASGGGQDLAPTIRHEIAELDGLVEEILLASRLDHGEDIGRRERVDCLALAAEEAARGGATVRAVAPKTPPFEVMGSPRLLRRMIRNLIENALKHGAPPVEIEVGRGIASITIAVYDQGPGILPALRERVFEPFFRPDGWSEDAGSWGLGLSLVRQIARRHGGDVAYAMRGGVAAFVVELPTGMADGRLSDQGAARPASVRSASSM